MNKISLREFERRIKVRFPTESFSIISYISLGLPMIILCDTCKQQINVSKANNFLAPTKAFGCKNCHGLQKKRDLAIEEIKQKYDILNTSVKETHTYYKIKCKKCGHIRESTLQNITRHLLCGCETKVKRNRTADEFIKEVNDNSTLGTYSLIGKYVNLTTKVLLKHNLCGFIWEVRPNDVIYGKSQCPKCGKKYSKMCLYIEKILLENNVNFTMEKRLNNSLLRFDFYLENQKYKIAIEYNGELHYKENDYFSTTLSQQQERDERKRKYCKENNIILYELPYNLTKDLIHNLIIEIINKFNDYPKRELIISL